MSHMQEGENFDVSRTSAECANTIVTSNSIRAHDTGHESPRSGSDGGLFCARLSQRAAFLSRKKLHWAGVRKNWSFFFSTMPDFQVEVLSEAVEGDTVWAELHYHGTQVDGKKHVTQG